MTAEQYAQFLDARTPPEEPAVVRPFLVAQETGTGVRYVRPPDARPRRRSLAPLRATALIVFLILAAAAVAGITLLAQNGASAPAWQWLVAYLYPIQLGLDILVVMRLHWRSIWLQAGELEIELSVERLRRGRHWGPFWLDTEDIPLARLRRLVVVKRPMEGTSGTSWDLVAERQDGSPVSLLSAYDEPGLIVPLAEDLHARLAKVPALHGRWPALAEEDWPSWKPARRRPFGPLLPGGAPTYLAVHVIGSVGLWQTLAVAHAGAPKTAWLTAAAGALVGLQLLIGVISMGAWQASRAARRT
jgi:hypothetical protein